MKLALIGTMLALCFCAQGLAQEVPAGLERVISYTTRNAKIRDIVQSIADLSGVNIVIDPKVKGEMPLNVQKVPAGEMLRLVAGITGNTVGLVRGVLVFGSQEAVRNVQGRGAGRLFRLSHAKSEDITALLNKIYKDDVEATDHKPSNSLFVVPK